MIRTRYKALIREAALDGIDPDTDTEKITRKAHEAVGLDLSAEEHDADRARARRRKSRRPAA